MTDPAGTLAGTGSKASNKPWTCLREAASAKAGRNLFNVEHVRPLPLLDLTPGEVLGYPFNSNKTCIPRRCLPAGRQGSVLVGSAQCNDEINSTLKPVLLSHSISYS